MTRRGLAQLAPVLEEWAGRGEPYNWPNLGSLNPTQPRRRKEEGGGGSNR